MALVGSASPTTGTVSERPEDWRDACEQAKLAAGFAAAHVMRLNPQQASAVSFVEGPLLVLAGAGSGKTAVITRKIAHLVADRGYLPERIAAITFTNKAAREMGKRVRKLLGDDGKGLAVGTFHALGLRFLHEESQALGYRRGFSIFDPRDCAAVLKELLPGAPSREAINQASMKISAWKAAGWLPEQAMQKVRGGDAELVATYADYASRMQRFNAFDFDDLILRPMALLENNPEIAEKWRSRFRHILVDEYQDTNGSQYRLLRALLDERASLTAVGDDDQSIYGWRGAQPENLALLKRDYPQLRVVKLEQNYRSVRNVLSAANAVIANNDHLFEKSLWSDHGDGEQIRIFKAATGEAEAERLVADMQYRRMTMQAPWSSFAVLYRSNHQARLIEQAFRTHAIPYVLSGGPSFFDRAEIKDLIAYLRLIANPRDDGAFLRIVNTPRRNLGMTTLDRLATLAGQLKTPLLEAAGNASDAAVGPQAAARLRKFKAWIASLSKMSHDPLKIFDRIADETQYDQWVRSRANDPRQGERRAQGVGDLRRWIERAAKGAPDLSKLLTSLSLETDRDEGSSDDALRMMTLHAAKGLEFPHVYMIGVEEGILPHINSLEDGQLAEERRLMYVGITRAERTLTMSWVGVRRRFGEVERCEPSRFLSEIPDQLVHWEGRDDERDATEAKERGTAQLAMMKAMFD